MSVIIRLDAIPITGLPQIVKSDPIEPYSTKINCILRCEQLPTHQHLEVNINGNVQPSTSEGKQIVISWQLEKASDEMRIKLFKRGVMTMQWQGCWNERDAILHVGTLPIRVFFNGKPQPLPAAMQPEMAEMNSNGHADIIPEPETSTYGANEMADTQHKNQSAIIMQDLQVITEPDSPSIAKDEPDKDEINGDEIDDDEIDDLEEDEMDGVGEDQDIKGEDSESFIVRKDLQAVTDVTATGPRIAAFHANPLAYEKTLETLKELLATMPQKTLIIDLRRHNQVKKRLQEQNGLSKDRLRAAFGAKYWDRGWAIQTTYRQDSSFDERFSRLRRVLVEPDNNPDGIPSFVKHLQAGYSIIVMDSQVSYGESLRRVVIEELQKRLPTLAVGPLQ